MRKRELSLLIKRFDVKTQVIPSITEETWRDLKDYFDYLGTDGTRLFIKSITSYLTPLIKAFDDFEKQFALAVENKNALLMQSFNYKKNTLLPDIKADLCYLYLANVYLYSASHNFDSVWKQPISAESVVD